MPVDVPALWTFKETIKCNHIPHDEFSHEDTPSRLIFAGCQKNEGTERESNPSLPPRGGHDAGVRPYTTVPFLLSERPWAVRLTVVATRALATLRGFTNPHERVTPWLHPFAEGLPVVGWDLANCSVCEPEARDVALRRQPVCQMCDCGIRHEEWPPDFQEGGRLDDLHVPPKVAGAVPKIPVPAAARPRLKLHR